MKRRYDAIFAYLSQLEEFANGIHLKQRVSEELSKEILDTAAENCSSGMLISLNFRFCNAVFISFAISRR